MREYEKNPEEYAANPIGGAGLIIGALLGAGALWWWSQRKKPAPAVLPPTTQTPLPAPPTPCEVTLEKLNTWGVQANIGVIYLPFLATPPDLPDLQATPLGPSVDQYISTGSIFVIVTSDGRFWTYPPRPGGGVYPTPEEQPELRGRYCRESAS